jgi:hypothetical protein
MGFEAIFSPVGVLGKPDFPETLLPEGEVRRSQSLSIAGSNRRRGGGSAAAVYFLIILLEVKE